MDPTQLAVDELKAWITRDSTEQTETRRKSLSLLESIESERSLGGSERSLGASPKPPEYSRSSTWSGSDSFSPRRSPLALPPPEEEEESLESEGEGSLGGPPPEYSRSTWGGSSSYSPRHSPKDLANVALPKYLHEDHGQFREDADDGFIGVVEAQD